MGGKWQIILREPNRPALERLRITPGIHDYEEAPLALEEIYCALVRAGSGGGMILTLTWKELREHQAIWLTMAGMTVVLGLGLAKLVSLNDPGMAVPTAAFTIFGMAAAYGVVCGSMMFAGEHEGGTLVFLDIFLGRRGLLWTGKVAIGTVLVLTQAVAVAAALNLMQQELPAWALALVGSSGDRPMAFGGRLDPGAWFLVLPVVALEAYAWGLLGSSITKRVLAGAAVAAIGFTPVWLFAILAPSPCFLAIRLVLAFGLLAISCSKFLYPADDAPSAPPSRAIHSIRKSDFLNAGISTREMATATHPSPKAKLPHIRAWLSMMRTTSRSSGVCGSRNRCRRNRRAKSCGG